MLSNASALSTAVPLVSPPAMQLACVTCRETLDITPLPHRPSPRHVHAAKRNNASGGGIERATMDRRGDSSNNASSSDAMRTFALLLNDSAVLTHDAMARCSACDGWFHRPCLAKQPLVAHYADTTLDTFQLPRALFTCAQCSSINSNSDPEDAAPHALLVPVAALPYLELERMSNSTAASNGNSNDDELKSNWVVFTKRVSVCTRCRQLDVAANDRDPCTSCNVAHIHARCCPESATLVPVSTGVNTHTQLLPVCWRDASLGMIALRSISLLVARADTFAWSRQCRMCTRQFCVVEFSDAAPSDPCGADAAGTGAGTDWTCMLCATTARTVASLPAPLAQLPTVDWTRLPSSSSSTSFIRPSSSSSTSFIRPGYAFGLPTADTVSRPSDALKLPAVGTVVDAPPKLQSPQPQPKPQPQPQPKPSPQPSSDLVTHLICDGCEDEFDMSAFVPPLAAIPTGDWYCPACAVRMTRVAPSSSSDPPDDTTVVTKTATTPVDSVEPATMPAVVTANDAALDISSNSGDDAAPLVAVTLLICDGCEGEFDMSALEPPLTDVPVGDWFCTPCAIKAARTAARNAKRRVRDKARREARKLAALSADPNTMTATAASVAGQPTSSLDGAPDEIVTLLICDGCEGEFDAALLEPPLTAIPSGDWYCNNCAASASVPTTAQSMRESDTPAATTMSTAAEPDVAPMAIDSVASEPVAAVTIGTIGTPSSTTKKRRRSSGLGYQPKRRSKTTKRSDAKSSRSVVAAAQSSAASEREPEVESVPGIYIPQPVVAPSRSTTATDDLGSSVMLLQLSDDDASDLDDNADVAHIVVCDLCHADFTLLDPVAPSGASTSTDPDATMPSTTAQRIQRPSLWYCIACVKSLKRSRKKRQRFSKQILLEMQVFGERLVPRAVAAAYDVDAAARRGKPPRTRIELAWLFALVGKRVGAYLKWDKHWIIGRVVAFDADGTAFHHVVQCDDGNERRLPLYALPLVIGTRTLVSVHVPTLPTQWWPAQVLRLNALAKKLLVPPLSAVTTDSSAAAAANFRLVSIFASSDSVGKTQNVACWVPKYLCRALSVDSDASSEPATSNSRNRSRAGSDENDDDAVGTDDLVQSLARARLESQDEDRVLGVAFKRLVRDVVAADDTDRVCAFGAALVGLELVERLDCGASAAAATSGSADHARAAFTVTAFDADTMKLVLQLTDVSTHDDVAAAAASTVERLELASAAHRFFIRDSAAYAELAVQFANHASGIDITIDSPSPPRPSATAPPPRPTCALCMLPARTEVDESDAAADDLVVCTKCPQQFHVACCDPPYATIALHSTDDSSVLVADVHAPYVCSACTECAGCLKRLDTDTQSAACWSQWRLPLAVASLCNDCVPYYQAQQFCAVCLRVLSDDALATCVALHSCSTCTRWVHAACEPDPHIAIAASSATDFELDVVVELPSVPSGFADPIDTDAPTTSVPVLVAEPSLSVDSESKPARLVDEAHALALQFKDTYDPKVLHKYECLACRTQRILSVLARLRAEDKLELFTEPVTRAIAPTYFDVIKEPMDLGTMQKRALARQYVRADFRDMRDDFELLCLNAVTFNSKDRDYLIWREAWRYYGQGQRILRQIAPKSRMNHRGGKYHDALVLAAKRQLPTNSAIGKTTMQLYDAFVNGTSGAGGEDDGGAGGSADGGNDDDLDVLDDRADTAAAAASTAADASASLLPATAVGAATGVTRDNESSSLRPAANDAKRSAQLPGDAVTPLAHRLGPAAVGSSERKLPVRAAVNTAIKLQSELEAPRLPVSAIPVFAMEHARSTAHTYAWLDMCLACGSAGLPTEFVFCVDCGEGFHAFCVASDAAAALNDAYWRCTNCKMCELCGCPGSLCSNGDTATAADALLFCSACNCGFHGACVVPAIQRPRSNSDTDGDVDDDVDHSSAAGRSARASAATPARAIYCASCVACRECGKPQPETAYSFDQHTCLSCSHTIEFEATLRAETSKPLVQLWTADARKQRKDSEKCPLCKLRWDPNDEELIQCDACELWAHPTCDALLAAEPARYRRLVDDPSAQYICEVCRPFERMHLAIVPGSSKCQSLIRAIQDKRVQVHAKWREARTQLVQSQQWKYWRDHTPVYLYVLRLGEACLRTLALRSVNFRASWTRWTRDVSSPDIQLPEWLVHKASRYMRFKRYARGPRAALRRHERKASSFYSRQGVERQRDASAIATIVAEAVSCAALLVCVHLFYGGAALPQVVLHLLTRTDGGESSNTPPLSAATLAMLANHGATSSPAMTLDDEIAMIELQYDRRVGKKPVVRDADASDARMSTSGVTEHDDNVGHKGLPVTVAVLVATTTTTPATSAPSDATVSIATAASTDMSAVPSVSRDNATSDLPSAATAKQQVVQMTRVPALCGWPSADTSESVAVVAPAPNSSSDGAIASDALVVAADNTTPAAPLVLAPAPPPADARGKFIDNRFCSFCFMMGDDAICGRLLYTDKDQYVHVNCALWSVEVYETPDGVLQKCQRAKTRSRLLRCDACGVLGASVGCAVSRCQRHFHFPCAYDAGVVFLPNGETCCPKLEHIAAMTRKQKLVTVAVVAEGDKGDDDGDDNESGPPLDGEAATSADTADDPTEYEVLDANRTDDNGNVTATDADATTASTRDSVNDVVVEADHADASAAAAATAENSVSTTDAAQPDAMTALRTVSNSVNAAAATVTTSVDTAADTDISEPTTSASESQPSAERVADDVAVAAVGSIDVAVDAVVSEPTASASESEPSLEPADDDKVGAAAVTTTAVAPVLPVVDPAPEPRRHLRSDLPVQLLDIKKLGAKARRTKRAPCLRLGALTVQSFGHIVVANPSFHNRDALMPLGYRSTRIFWSARLRATRCLYECVVTSSDIEARAAARAATHLGKRAAPGDDSSFNCIDRHRTPARAVFKIVASDDRAHPIVASSPDAAVLELRARVAALYDDAQCFGYDATTAERNPFVTRTSWNSYGLAGAHFFGFGLPAVAAELEQLPHAATTSIRRSLVAARIRQTKQPPLRRTGLRTGRTGELDNASSGTDDDADIAHVQDEAYVFTQHLPTPQQFADALQQVEALVAAEERARLSTGSTRTDGLEWHAAPAVGSAPIRRRLNKHASRELSETGTSATGGSASGSSATGGNGATSSNSVGGSSNAGLAGSSAGSNANAATATNSNSVTTTTNSSSSSSATAKSSSGGVAMDLEHLPIAMQYRELRRRPFDDRLEVRKSAIHGYGLFTKEPIAEGQMIVEYQGQMIAQDVADARERQYELQGIGSCYMFRLDDTTIIDATRVGNLARFINHSCDPKAFARVVTVEAHEKKIVIFAKRAIDAGDEVTYDYKFPIEDEAIRCDCSAPNCIGRMN